MICLHFSLRIIEFIRHFESAWIDHGNGLCFSFLDHDSMCPAEDEFFAGARETGGVEVSGFSLAELYRHENFGMVTGAYVMAELLRYQSSGDAAALGHARRGVHGLFGVYEMGKELAEGFLPKIYGGRFSRETSTDQVLYTCCALEAFYPYADHAERRRIETVIPGLVRFWMQRDYRYRYFQVFGADWQWPLVRFPALLILAWKFSQDEAFLKEYRHLIDHTRMPEHCQLWNRRLSGAPDAFELANHGWLTINGADRITMDTMQFELLLRHDPEHPLAECWREGMRLMWQEVKDSITPDGRYYSMTIYDFDTGKLKRPSGSLEWHGAKSAWSTMVVRGALQQLPHCPELADEVIPLAQLVLEQLDFSDCTYYDEPERFAPHERFKTRLLSGDSCANWLWSAQLLQQHLSRQQAGQVVAVNRCHSV